MTAKLLKFPRHKVHVFTNQELINLYKNAYSEKESEPFDHKLFLTISVGFVAGVVLTAFLVSLL